MAFPPIVCSSGCTDVKEINQKSIEITSIVMDEIETIVSIENSSFPEPWSRDIFIRELQLPVSRNLVAKIHKEPGSEIAGYIIYWLIAGEAQVHKIAVRKDLRKSGIASKIMEEMLRLSCEEGAEVCLLEVGRANESARKLYEKFGFMVTEIRREYYAQTGDDAMIMCLKLKK